MKEKVAQKIYHLNCPSCGGSLHIPEGKRVIACPYCSSNNLLIFDKDMPRYYIEPVLDRFRATRKAHQALSLSSAPADLSDNSQLLAIHLFFVPFYETVGKRLGTVLTQKETYEAAPTKAWETPVSSYGEAPAAARKVTKRQEDTRVEFKDYYYTGPAVSVKGWNLDKILIGNARGRQDKALLHAYNIIKMQKLGQVLGPTVPRDAFEKRQENQYVSRHRGNKIYNAEQRTRLTYYPLWVAKYAYKKRLYKIVIDGNTKEIVAGRAPQREDRRIPIMLAICILLAIPLGKIPALLGHYFSSNNSAETVDTFLSILVAAPYLGASVVFGFFFFLFLFMALAWDEFRYGGEVVFEPGGTRIEKINRPAETWPDKLLNLLRKKS